MLNRIRSPPSWFLELINFENQGGILMCKENKYYLELEDDSREYVSEKIFKEYWKLVNRENYLKKLDRKQKILSLNLVDEDGKEFAEILESEIDVEKIVETAEKINTVKKAIRTLNPREQELIRKMFYDDLTETEIARLEGVSRKSVWERRMRAFNKLRKILKNL